ncbi:SNF2-related protein, partial [Thermus sp.]|uniref:SNF2-related protein n=1 Tax=Thermus sp. TaxID=275 RepID=UPI0025FDD362
RLIELEQNYARESNADVAEDFARRLQQALSHPRMDFPGFPEQARFFLELLRNGRLELRACREPTHAKLYLFKVKPDLLGLLPAGGSFITGSSNLTYGGLEGQLEFNVEIKDYGFPEAEAFFDKLWDDAAPIRNIARIEEIIKRGSLAAEPTPLEVYALLLQRYLEAQQRPLEREGPRAFLERAGYTPYLYQLEAMENLLTVLEQHGGAILADVVGLGKSVVASLVGREWGGRGLILAPPHLIGEVGEYGWADYLERFGLYDWRIYSTGKLEEALAFLQGPGRDVGLVVVDEAHRFRNPETRDYALLSAITRGRRVLLLTATPINNRPQDVYALLRLFIAP